MPFHIGNRLPFPWAAFPFLPMKNPIVLIFCIMLAGLFSGCVTGRRTFDLGVPPAVSYPTSAPKGPIVLGQIDDVRHFENHPSSPSTPSIDGDVNQLSAASKSTFIGRQRGSFGKAWGDITLPGGETVQTKITELLSEGLKRRGFSIGTGASTENSVSAEIEQFWAWMTPGVFALSFEAQITCRVAVIRNGKEVVFHVHGYGLNHGQFAKDINWQQAYDETFKDFLTNLNVQLEDAGL